MVRQEEVGGGREWPDDPVELYVSMCLQVDGCRGGAKEGPCRDAGCDRSQTEDHWCSGTPAHTLTADKLNTAAGLLLWSFQITITSNLQWQVLKQGSHASWKTWKMIDQFSSHGKWEKSDNLLILPLNCEREWTGHAKLATWSWNVSVSVESFSPSDPLCPLSGDRRQLSWRVV